MTFGPVSAAQHSEPTVLGALFFMGIGVSVSIYVWFRYFNSKDEGPKPPIGNMIWITGIACVFIGAGIWELVRALRLGG